MKTKLCVLNIKSLKEATKHKCRHVGVFGNTDEMLCVFIHVYFTLTSFCFRHVSSSHVSYVRRAYQKLLNSFVSKQLRILQP